MTNFAATATIHYDATGNGYWGVNSSGFCGSTGPGAYTIARDDVTCETCLARVAR